MKAHIHLCFVVLTGRHDRDSALCEVRAETQDMRAEAEERVEHHRDNRL